ncbi:1-acyl-sn-glycerol-3-phosphate acyltransferase [Solirubrobacter soli]|uniref:1-acyl-sn-glycerol-3-phosphate acyltransferase n=1 Tax=Solirubrobacter soli TaxID=363832 RepID=UPI000424CE68|nr:1-acyl-sn-glycerol-3-phosphate acyltransferase [Solirubrobacter soli]
MSSLGERDPDHIRAALPRLWLQSSLWHRAEVRGLGNVPEDGPVLLVGNHSGGAATPDTTVFALAFSTYFGVERLFHQLADVPSLRRFGSLAPTLANARRALDSGAAVLAYPGGEREARRPSWQRHRVDLGQHTDFIRIAIERDVPLVPVVAVGGQETAMFLGRGPALPLLLPPLPAKITIDVVSPIHPLEEFGGDLDAVYEHLERLMQETLDALASERRFPVLG